MIITSSENLNKTHNIESYIYTFIQNDNNESKIIISSDNDGYILFNLSLYLLKFFKYKIEGK